MKKSPHIPRLRFPEFRNAPAWGEKRLGEVAFLVTDKISAGKLSKDNYLSTESILPRFRGVVFGHSIPPQGRVTFFKRGDILLSNIRIYLEKLWLADREGGCSNDCLVFRANNKIIISSFLYSVQASDPFIEYATGTSKGVKMPRGDKDSLLSYLIFFPSLLEQQKIAECLSSLDALIEATLEKAEQLKSYKKGLMQQLFPREGETVPRLRFPEFRTAPAWEEKRLGEVCESFSGGTPSTAKAEYYGGDIPFIRSGEIGLGKTELFITSEGLENSSAKIIHKGEVLYALYGANSGDVALSRQRGAINQAILCLRNPENSCFLYQVLLQRQQEIISTYIQGGQGNLSGEIIRSIRLLFPSLLEQQKIAECLSSLDALIEATSEKAEQLKIYKKGLMQQLFPREG